MDSQIVITKRDEKIGVSCHNVDLPDMAMMLGVLAGMVVTEAVKRGMPVDDVKDTMLEIFLASTARLDEDTVEDIIKDTEIF